MAKPLATTTGSRVVTNTSPNVHGHNVCGPNGCWLDDCGQNVPKHNVTM